MKREQKKMMVTMRLSGTEYKNFQKVAVENDLTMTEMVRQAVKEFDKKSNTQPADNVLLQFFELCRTNGLLFTLKYKLGIAKKGKDFHE